MFPSTCGFPQQFYNNHPDLRQPIATQHSQRQPDHLFSTSGYGFGAMMRCTARLDFAAAANTTFANKKKRLDCFNEKPNKNLEKQDSKSVLQQAATHDEIIVENEFEVEGELAEAEEMANTIASSYLADTTKRRRLRSAVCYMRERALPFLRTYVNPMVDDGAPLSDNFLMSEVLPRCWDRPDASLDVGTGVPPRCCRRGGRGLPNPTTALSSYPRSGVWARHHMASDLFRLSDQGS
jgi:hypothetical protein